MTSQDDLLRELQETFRAEAAEYLETLNMTLLQLERVIDDETKYQALLKDAFRIAHNMKGAARTMGYTEIDSLSHSLENVLQQARDNTLMLDPAVCDVLYAALDAIKTILNGDTIDLTTIYARLLKVASTTDRGQAGTVDSATVNAETTHEQPPAVVEESVLEPAVEPVDQSTANDKTIRVPVTRLDNLMAEAGELLVSKISAEQHLSDMTDLQYSLTLWPKAMDDFNSLLRHINGSIGLELSEHLMQHQEYLQSVTQRINVLQQHFSRDAIRLGIITNRIQEEVQQVRLMPFGSITSVLQRTVRDAARTEGKLVNALHITGADVELDKKVLEMLKDPLLHLLRNAIAHGIETPEKRRAVGKPEQGNISIAVQQRGSEIFIEVRDDGRGFDLEALRQHGSSNGNGSAPHDDASVDDLIGLAFQPGVSTATHVNEIAGRGVGLDVVRNTITNLQGHIDVDTLPGKGTAFQLWVPLSLATTQGLLVRVGKEQYVIPLLSVEKIIQPDKSFSLQGQTMLTVDGKHIPLVPLAYSLNRPRTDSASEPLAVIIKSGDQQIGLLVEDVMAQQEVTVKPLSKLLHRVTGVAGAALIGNGEPVIVLNIADLMKSARTFRATARSVEQPVVTSQAEPDMLRERGAVHILVVDDSITTRTLEKNILQAAGFHVTTAVDGGLALRQIRENSIDLVVSDVQMPNMDGITLAQSIRASSQYNHLPIILVTSLESAEDKQRGLEAGANAYIVKRGFDQAELLETIQRLLLGVQP